ncbi:hypothetical protein RJ641_003680 [Dillenia turbinata]|uniref:Uncharacterized protein n=1 Tax=Dillenia turbinata TaxID=194707 RepID=A0AAN8VGP8_9MAGN
MHSGTESTLRGSGQRSIKSSFIFTSTKNRSNDTTKGDQNSAPKKDVRVSLSDFLNRKLHKAYVPSKSVQGKQRPFSSAVSRENDVDGEIGVKERKEEEEFVLNRGVFEQFKRNESENCGGEISGCDSGDLQESRKRKNPFQGGEEKLTAKRHLLVLGGDPTPKQSAKSKDSMGKENSTPQFNPYANGSGWWDCDREGIDNEEVGFNEVWEGKRCDEQKKEERDEETSVVMLDKH